MFAFCIEIESGVRRPFAVVVFSYRIWRKDALDSLWSFFIKVLTHGTEPVDRSGSINLLIPSSPSFICHLEVMKVVMNLSISHIVQSVNHIPVRQK